MTAVARAYLEAKIEWGSYPAGTLAIATNDADTNAGSIAADDDDIGAGGLAGSDWTATFGGAHDDVSDLVAEARIEAGRDDLLSSMLAGTATLTLRDPTGKFNHANPASPLYGQIADRMHPVKIRVGRDGVWRDRFYGFTRRVRWQPSGRKGVAVVECVDLFYWLQRAKPIIAATGPTTTGAAIGLILDSIRWIDPAARDLDVGDSIPDFEADGSDNGLGLVGGLLEAERGVFYIRGPGVAVYEDRHARYFRATEATIVDRMTNLEPEVDFDLQRNRVRVKRVNGAGDVTYTAEAVDDDSVVRIGYADADEIATPYLSTDAQAENLADWILPIVSDPTAPVRALEIDGRDTALLDTILDLELVDKVALDEEAGGTLGAFHIERHALAIRGGGRVSGSYLLSKASSFTALAIAADDADTAVGSIAADDDDTAAGVIVY